MTDACVFRRRFDGGSGASIGVYHNPLLDGGGTWLAEPFVQLLRREQRSLGTVFEFCAGPGFIAFALLADGLAHAAVLAGVNPIAVECARKTVRGDLDRVRVHLANGTRGLPASERGRFDTVVTDWPNYEHFRARSAILLGARRRRPARRGPGMAAAPRVLLRDPKVPRAGRAHVHRGGAADGPAGALRYADRRRVGALGEPCDERSAAPLPVHLDDCGRRPG